MNLDENLSAEEMQSLDLPEEGGEVSGGDGGREAAATTAQAQAPQSAQPQTQNAATTTTPVEEFEFNWNGKPVKGDRTKVLKWASQGYDYAQRIAELKQQRQEFERSQKEYEQKYSPYQEIDSYAKQNPQWWQTIQEAYSQRENQQQAAQNPEFNHLRSELQELKQFKTQFETEQQQAKTKAEDEQLAGDIQSIRKDYSDLDWNTLDEYGQSLEQRVLKHAVDNGISNFRAAFRDYNYDNLVKAASEKAKTQLGQNLQQTRKAGILGKSQTPVKGAQAVVNSKKSWGDLTNQAVAEYMATEGV